MVTAAESAAMATAVGLASSVVAEFGPNPRVGCVLLDADGTVISQGAHYGAGQPHAEVVALRHAGERARGATAVVTLEPCAHTGRTGPCTAALISAGVRRVVIGAMDPNPAAAGGAQVLRAAGVDVEVDTSSSAATELNHRWRIAVGRGRPFVTLKIASSLDGRIAAADGTSRWITGDLARAQVHQMRSDVDAVVVGTGTALADDPALTDRRPGALRQPQAVVIGMRELPPTLQLCQSGALMLRTRDLGHVMTALFERDVRSVLVEGGPTLATSLIRDSLVDELVWYVAPVLLGGGRNAIADLGITTIDDASRWQRNRVTSVGSDVRIDLTPVTGQDPGGPITDVHRNR
ncbi:MAG: bifunctional diaminohydroxyphosphoribosylaminopyrimidine deaminase/5-amino-6-(5-phosphoribosylamino)uracil reductase RibD [Candidatus Nanopelagicales bacterium]